MWVPPADTQIQGFKPYIKGDIKGCLKGVSISKSRDDSLFPILTPFPFFFNIGLLFKPDFEKHQWTLKISF